MSKADEVEQRAAEWLSRKDGSGWSQRDQTAYETWLDASPANAIAAARLEEVWNAADVLNRRNHVTVRRSAPHRFAIPAAIAASLVAVVGGSWMWEMRGSVVHRTHVGQREEVRLADGSNLDLNTNTKVIAVVADGTREVWLDHGEAFFEIAHDRAHPFLVHAGNQLITVLGTKFTVYKEGDKFRVAVLSGRVRLTSLTKSTERPIILPAGTLATSTGDDVLVSTQLPPEQLDDLAWRRGTIIFDKVTLGQAIDQLNRYSDRKLVLADPDLASLEIGGRFSTDSVESFALLLKDSLKLKVRDGSDKIEISQ